MGTRSVFAVLLCVPALVALAQGATSYSLAQALKLVKGDAKFKTALEKTPAKDLVRGDFYLTMVDLDGDGQREAIVQAASPSSCSAGRCATMVLKKEGSGWIKIFEQTLPQAEYIGVTNEKSGAYRLLASLDAAKQIAVADKKPLVYAIGGTQSASAVPSTRSAPSGSASALKANDVFGIKLGMSVSDVKGALGSSLSSASNFPITMKSYGTEWTGMYASLPAGMTKQDNRFDKKAAEVVVVDFTQPPGKQEVWAVAKFQAYPQGKTPSLKATEDALTQKYGQWDRVRENRGTNFYYWGQDAKPDSPCVAFALVNPDGRLNDVVRAEGSQAVICQGYGVWAQCLKPARDFLKLDSSIKACGVRAAAYVRYTAKEGKDTSPVTEAMTIVIDFSKYFDSEVAFGDFARKYEKDKNTSAIKSGGAPKF